MSMSQEEYESKKAQFVATMEECSKRLLECQDKIDSEDSKRDKFREKRKGLWTELSACRARKAELYATVQRVRLQLSEADRKRMDTRRNVQVARRELKVSHTDLASLNEAITELETAKKAGDASAGTQLALLTQQRPHIQRVDQMIAAEAAEEAAAAELKAEIEAVCMM